jgi:hypothetical protein
LYGCENWSVTLREEGHRLKMVENESGHMKEEITRG